MMEVLQTPKVLKLDSRHQSVVGGGCIHSDSGWKRIPAAWALGFDFGFGFGVIFGARDGQSVTRIGFKDLPVPVKTVSSNINF